MYSIEEKQLQLEVEIFTLLRKLNEKYRDVVTIQRGILTPDEVGAIDSLYTRWCRFEIEAGLVGPHPDKHGFIAKRKSKLHKSQRDESNFFISDIRHDDPRMLDFRRNLFERLTREIPKSDENKFGVHDARAVPGKWDKLLSVTGKVPDRVGYHFLNNSVLRTNEGLSLDFFDDLDREIFRTFLAVLFEHFSWEQLKFANKSSSGAPDLTYGSASKAIKALHALVHVDDVMSLVREGNNDELVRRYRAAIAFVAGKRTQNDAFGKKRYLVEFDDAIRGNGKRVLIDNSLKDEYGRDTGLVKQRWRDVFGLNNVLNSLIQGPITCFYNGLCTRFPETFKVTTKDVFERQINSQLDKWISSGSEPKVSTADVSNFDQHFFGPAAAEFISYIRKYISADLADIIDICRHAPVFYPPRFVGDEGRWLGDYHNPLQFRDEVHVSHYSGIAVVTILNAVGGCGDTISRVSRGLEQLGLVSRDKWLDKQFIRDFLSWKGPLLAVTANRGDDQLLCCANKAVEDAIYAQDGWWKVEREPGRIYLGYVLYSEGRNIKLCHNINTYVTNFINPEHGSEHVHNKYIGVGWHERKFVYDDAPLYHRVNLILDEEFGKLFPGYPKLSELVEAQYTRDLQKLQNELAVLSVSHIEAEVLADPSKLSWKFSDSDDISAAVRAAVGQSLTPAISCAILEKPLHLYPVNDGSGYLNKLFTYEVSYDKQSQKESVD